MIHVIWAGMLILSIGYSMITGDAALMTEAVMEGAKEAVNLCLVMAAVVGLWSGMMEIAVESGIVDKLAKLMGPFLKWMFPNLKQGGKAMKYIASNFAANILGLGWAATPAGLEAMEELKSETGGKKGQRDFASDEMCTFVLLNVSSLQLIPLTVILYRSQYGSSVPAAIVMPGIIATFVSTITAVLFAKSMCGKS